MKILVLVKQVPDGKEIEIDPVTNNLIREGAPSIQVVLWLGLDTNLLKLLSALVVAMFLALPYWKGKIHLKKGGRSHA